MSKLGGKLQKLLNKFPYLIAFLVGVVLFILVIVVGDNVLKGKLSDLLINLSASLIAIPIVLYTYEIIKQRLAKDKDRDVSEYVKMNIDREIITLIKRITPIVIKYSVNSGNALKILKLQKKAMLKSLEEYRPMAYYLATDWGFIEDQFMNLIANELVYNNLSVDERNAFVKLIKVLRELDSLTDPKFFRAVGKPDETYKIVPGTDFDPTTEYKTRYLLIKEVKATGEHIVMHFNDIKKGKYLVNLLTPMKASSGISEKIIDCIFELRELIDVWATSRGSDFILDSRNFRVKRSRTQNRLDRLGDV